MFRTLNTIPLSSRVFPITVPPLRDLEGTHGDRVAGDNTQRSHRLLSFSFYVTRSRTKKPNSSAHLYFSSSSAFAISPPCGSCSVFEAAHTVNNYTLNKFSFGCGCPTRVIPREQSDRGNLAARRTLNKHIPFISTP